MVVRVRELMASVQTFCFPPFYALFLRLCESSRVCRASMQPGLHTSTLGLAIWTTGHLASVAELGTQAQTTSLGDGSDHWAQVSKSCDAWVTWVEGQVVPFKVTLQSAVGWSGHTKPSGE